VSLLSKDIGAHTDHCAPPTETRELTAIPGYACRAVYESPHRHSGGTARNTAAAATRSASVPLPSSCHLQQLCMTRSHACGEGSEKENQKVD